ncbi:MAG: alkaline phosphatase D family protein [Akkermansiaceae bacterium]
MIKRFSFQLIFPSLFLQFGHCEVSSENHDPNPIQKIAFGSCYSPRDKNDEIFKGILKQEPDLFVFLGDNIYGDTEDMAVLKKKYAELEAVEGFAKLRASTRLFATWDDHDFGVNDGGKSYPMREESEAIFLDFFKDPAESPRRKREGVYGAYTFGPQGKTVQLILLDTRYFRDELVHTRKRKAPDVISGYSPTDDQSLTLLGADQWKWLEEQLHVPADIRIIGSSIQLLALEKGMENWGNVPHEQKRLFDLLKKHQAHGTFAISGDVHFAELSKTKIGDYPFYDMTSSGMSKPRKIWAAAANSYRLGESHSFPNAGLIEIDWKSREVELSVINAEGEKVAPKAIPLRELTFPE